MKVIYNMKNRMIQEFQHCLESENLSRCSFLPEIAHAGIIHWVQILIVHEVDSFLQDEMNKPSRNSQMDCQETV
jgi:hypothetical protein